MAKFRIRLKLQALDLDIDGEREYIPAITSAVQQQFAGLITLGAQLAAQPPADVVKRFYCEYSPPRERSLCGNSRLLRRRGGR
jgi:hypothetical protein